MEDWFSEPRAGKLRLQWLVSRLRLVGRTVGASEPRAKLVSEPRCRASIRSFHSLVSRAVALVCRKQSLLVIATALLVNRASRASEVAGDF